MTYCSNCGKCIDDEAKFCCYCGVSNANNAVRNENNEEFNIGNHEYAESMKKCPGCGSVIPSLTAVCLTCGNEINNTKVSSTLKSFADSIDNCDRMIASSCNLPKTGLNSWSKKARTWWVVLNIFTACIPLVIYYTVPLFRYGSTPVLTNEEKKKVSIIENYIIPNERESIIEVLLFIKSKTDFMVSEELNRKTAYWTRVWTEKARQIYHKAEIVLRDDVLVKNTYVSILDNSKKIQDKVKKKAIIGWSILLILFLLMLANY